jgi:hypothetical protein
VSLRKAGKLVVVVCSALGLAAGAIGCLSDDTSLSPVPRDAGGFDAGIVSPVFDASGTVDVNAPPVDAGGDAEAPDASLPVEAGVDAGRDAAASPSQVGLVAGGSVGHSPGYKMTGTTGPATAPVLKSPHYQFVGGVSATGQKP